MSSARRRELVHERLNAVVAKTRGVRARPVRQVIAVTEKGWAAPKVENDATHEWAYVHAAVGCKIQRCMNCPCEKRSSRDDSVYAPSGRQDEAVEECPPCPAKVRGRPASKKKREE